MVHLKYPSMERQDLTQGQLGSFKFTPVDEASHHSPYVHPLLLSRYAHLPNETGLGDHPVQRSHAASDPSFFNHQIRPALDQSRLRLGPAVVRAAVESASPSPQKQRSQNVVQDHMHGNAQNFFPHYLTSSEHESLPSLYMSDIQNSEMSAPPPDNLYGISPSLLRALENEQDAHNSTKSFLERETSLREEAEAKIKLLQDHNQGLLNSIKLLQSTVKHMVNKENKPVASLNIALEHAVQQYNKEVENTKLDNSILYDTLATYKANGGGKTDTGNGPNHIDLDLLDTLIAGDNSENAELQHTLRKQIGVTSDEKTKEFNDIYHKNIDALVSESQKLSLRSELQRKEETLDELMAGSQDSERGTQSEHDAKVPKGPSETFVPKEQPPMLELPAMFLSKWGKRPEQPNASENENTTSISTVNDDKSDVEIEQSETRGCAKSYHLSHSPFIDWKVDGRHANELRGSEGGFRATNSHFEQHPVRYVPKVTAPNIYRTVMIDFIPVGAKYSDILAHIRGGALESIQLYGTIGSATDFATARVVFTHELGATNLYQRGQDPGIKLEGRALRVWQVLEPTYPKNLEIEKAIYDESYTRILLINAPHLNGVDNLLKQKLSYQAKAGFILDFGTSFEGLPLVEFTSIEEAMKALNTLMRDADFGGACFDFEDDYCAARYAT